jgi:hypothetical protein
VRPPVETVAFLRSAPDAVVARMAALAADHRGWINLAPTVVEDEEADRPAGLFALFTATGPPVPLCTWSPGERRRRGVGPPSVGIQHGTGPKAVRRLAGVGSAPPDGWTVLQDHPRRGLVVRPLAGEAHEAVLGWLLQAGEALCLPAVTGRWTAAVFTSDA